MKAKISIIVPVYNTGRFLKRCLNSLVNQTYQNIEIIIINDGSTDNSEKICEKYTVQYQNVYYYKKENSGLSDSRNYGLSKSNGDLISFIDSDDYIELDMLEKMVKSMSINQSDIVVCGYIADYPDKHINIAFNENICYSRKDAIRLLVEDKVMRSFSCTKLYKKELFENISFPKGLYYEDVYTTYKLFLNANKISCIADACYHYIQRDNSITNCLSIEKQIDLYKGFLKQKEELNQYYPEFDKYFEKNIIISLLLCLRCLNFKNLSEKKYSWIMDELKTKKYKTVLYLDFPTKNKLEFLLCKSNKYLYFLLRGIKNRVNKNQ